MTDHAMLVEEKKFYERFWALHGDERLVRIYERYGIAAFRRSSVLEGLVAFMKEQEFVGDVCVEIGSLKGLTAFMLSRQFNHVVSIDIIDDPQRHEFASFLGVENVTFLTVANNAEKAKVINGLHFDAAYVDADHTHDTETDFELVRRCKRVLFHEHWEAQPAVMKLVRSLETQGRVAKKGKLALWTA